MTHDEICSMIKRHEGCSARVYLDTVGIPTGGYGHAFLPGSPVSLSASEAFFRDDMQSAIVDYERLLVRADIPHLDPVRRAVLIDMLFNLGLPRLLTFKRMLTALSESNFKRAAAEMLDSKWADQVAGRATELAEMMRTGAGKSPQPPLQRGSK